MQHLLLVFGFDESKDMKMRFLINRFRKLYFFKMNKRIREAKEELQRLNIEFSLR